MCSINNINFVMEQVKLVCVEVPSGVAVRRKKCHLHGRCTMALTSLHSNCHCPLPLLDVRLFNYESHANPFISHLGGVMYLYSLHSQFCLDNIGWVASTTLV